MLLSFQGMLEKLLLRKFWKIIRKTSLVASLNTSLKNSNYKKTDSAANNFFVCFENLKIGLRVESHLSKVTDVYGFCREI